MKAFITKFLATALSLLVLISTVSVTVNQHLCMGEVVDIAFYTHAKSCGMEQDAPNSGLARKQIVATPFRFPLRDKTI